MKSGRLMVTIKNINTRCQQTEKSGCTYMDETDFSEDKIYKQQEDFPHDEAISNVETRKDYDFTSKMDICDISNQIILTVDDPQDKTYGNVAMILDKITENTVNKKHDKQCTIILHIPPSKEMMSKSNISDILLNHLSKEEFFKGQGIDCETLPDISNADSFDDAIIKKIAFCYVKKSPPKEQISEHYDKLSPRKDDANSKPSSPAMVEDSVSDLEEPVVAGRSSIQGYSSFLTKAQGPGDQHQSFQGQAPQNQQTEKSSYSDGFKYGQGQVHYRLPDVSKVAPRVKISKNNTTNKSLTVARQAKSSPDFSHKSALVQDLLEEDIPRSICVEKQHQEPKEENVKPSQQMLMESTERSHQNHLTGIDFETSLFGLSSTSQENSSSSSKIFEKISKGKQMCQKLREQTDQLKAKVQDFSKRIAQDSHCSQKREKVLEKLQGHLELLEQEFLATKEKHLTLQQQQGPMDQSPAVSDFDPERKVGGESFKLEMLLEDVKEKIDERKHPSPPLLAMDPTFLQADLVSTAAPASNEISKEHPDHPSVPLGTCGKDAGGVTPAEPSEPPSQELQELDSQIFLNPSGNVAPQYLPDHTSPGLSSFSREGSNTTTGGQDRAETTVPSPSCASCHWALERKQRMERRGHRKACCGRFSIIIQENPMYLCSTCSSDGGDSLHLDSGSGLRKNKCEHCSVEILTSRTVVSADLRKAYSKPKRICPQRENFKSSQDEPEPRPKKDVAAFTTCSSDLTMPSPRSHSRRIYGNKTLSDFRNTDKMESEVLNSALDRALRTATILKETTDQMIKAIADDLAKAQKWRSRLKH